MLDFDEEVVRFKFKGEIHEVKKPTNGMIRSYNDRTKGLSDDDLTPKFTDFLSELGLSSEIYDQLNPEQAKKIVEQLYSTEKN
jgi:hypothetical protein